MLAMFLENFHMTIKLNIFQKFIILFQSTTIVLSLEKLVGLSHSTSQDIFFLNRIIYCI